MKMKSILKLFVIFLSLILPLHAKVSKVLWSIKTGKEIDGSPCIWDGKVYFGSYDKNIYCLDAISGNTFWKLKTGDKIASSPCIWDGKVYFGSDDGKLYCIDAGTPGMKGVSFPSISGMDTMIEK